MQGVTRKVAAHQPSNSADLTRIRGYAEASIRSTPMMDIAMLVIALVFFALSVAYVYACDLL